MSEALLQRILETLERIERQLAQQPTITVWPTKASPQPVTIPAAPYYAPTPVADCGCPPNGTCMNTACPRAVKVSTRTDGVGWPD